MLVIALERAPARLRGRLALWMLEVRAGLYVADLSKRVRERLIETVQMDLGEGNAVILWSTNNEAGYELRTFGQNRRTPVDWDGYQLISFLPEQAHPEE